MTTATHIHQANNAQESPADHASIVTPLLQKPSAVSSSIAETVKDSFADWFSWEVLCAIIATLSYIAISAVLVIFDESSLPDWPSIFTINSIVSFFASLSQISFMAAVGASISQSKWLWFRGGPRPLSDIQEFDDASRGPWGAFGFLLKFRTSTFASLGSIVVVMSLLYGPFVQQLVSYSDRTVPSGQVARIVRAQRYLAPSFEGLALPSVVDLSMKAAIYSGAFDARNQANSSTEFQCSTGNCTFDECSSLAVGSTCVDITGRIEESCRGKPCSTFSIPGGPSLSGPRGQINSSVTKISSELQSIQASIVQFSTIISRNSSGEANLEAWECALYYCINKYSAKVEGGKLEQSVSRTWRNDSAISDKRGDLIYEPPWTESNETLSYYVDDLAARALNSFMSNSLTGNGRVYDDVSGSAFSSDMIHALYETNDLPLRMDNLVVSMTNNIRQQNNSGSFPMQGVALKSETILQVRWAWSAYSASVLALSLSCLIATVIETQRRRITVWKSSEIALLFHGRRLPLSDNGRILGTSLSTMSEKAGQVKVKLMQEPGSGTWQLRE